MQSRNLFASTLIALAVTTATSIAAQAPSAGAGARYLVQASTVSAANQDVARAGGKTEQNLPIIHAVSAHLNPGQVARLRRNRRRTCVRRSLAHHRRGRLAGVAQPGNLSSGHARKQPPDTRGRSGHAAPDLAVSDQLPHVSGADALQNAGVTGKGVTIAVLDSGLWQDPSQNYGSRLLASVDVLNGGSGPVKGDPYGHGTHVTSIAAGGAMNISGSYLSIAPQANLVAVRAFDGTGSGRYADVIAGLNWIVANRTKYNIRVLNLSFGATPESYYWTILWRKPSWPSGAPASSWSPRQATRGPPP